MTVAAVGILGGAGLVGLGIRGDKSGATVPLAGTFGTTTKADQAAAAKPTPTGPTAAELAAAERAKRVKALNTALTAYAASAPEFSVAVLDKKTGQRYSYRGTESYETASVVKVQVLACLLLTAQKTDRDLTSSEMALAKLMIQHSDNDATTSLFGRLGRAPAVQACDNKLGLTQTKVNSSWGLTRTTVNDQVKLLSQLVSTKSPLNAASRKLAFSLMSTVADDQDWGVPVVARAGETATVKNGWLARSADNNLWIINTVGRITGGSTDVSIAVLSHNNTSQLSGEAVVQKVAKLTRQYLKY